MIEIWGIKDEYFEKVYGKPKRILSGGKTHQHEATDVRQGSLQAKVDSPAAQLTFKFNQ
jgi:hypothetical protein